jgi:hypothetical protein
MGHSLVQPHQKFPEGVAETRLPAITVMQVKPPDHEKSVQANASSVEAIIGRSAYAGRLASRHGLSADSAIELFRATSRCSVRDR